MIVPLLKLLRPHQWLKNLLLLFPPFLGGAMFEVPSAEAFALPLISFSAAASSIYIINDIFDLSQDINHPRKCKRPLPSGQVKMSVAIVIALILLSSSIFFGFLVSPCFLLLLLSYLAVSITYSSYLKSIPIIEMFCVVSGFLFRLQAGGIAYHVKVSDWLFLSVFLLALFLVSGKRLGELKHSTGQPPEMIRPVLALYPEGFFHASMYLSGAAVLVTYAMYVISHHGNLLVIPLCCFGLLSYLRRVLSGQGGDPTRALLSDPILLVVGLAWAGLVGADVYLKM
jgi:4-hydroxybenzoate polyprenyltransferase